MLKTNFLRFALSILLSFPSVAFAYIYSGDQFRGDNLLNVTWNETKRAVQIDICVYATLSNTWISLIYTNEGLNNSEIFIDGKSALTLHITGDHGSGSSTVPVNVAATGNTIGFGPGEYYFYASTLVSKMRYVTSAGDEVEIPRTEAGQIFEAYASDRLYHIRFYYYPDNVTSKNVTVKLANNQGVMAGAATSIHYESDVERSVVCPVSMNKVAISSHSFGANGNITVNGTIQSYGEKDMGYHEGSGTQKSMLFIDKSKNDILAYVNAPSSHTSTVANENAYGANFVSNILGVQSRAWYETQHTAYIHNKRHDRLDVWRSPNDNIDDPTYIIPPYPQPKSLIASLAHKNITFNIGITSSGNGNSPTDGYDIQWKRSGTSTWNNFSTPVSGNLTYDKNETSHSVTFAYPQLEQGTVNYDFRVKRHNMNWGVFDATLNNFAIPTSRVSLRQLSASAEASGIRVRWDINQGYIEAGWEYRVYRKETEDGVYGETPVYRFAYASESVSDDVTKEWLDENINLCVTYYYKVELWSKEYQAGNANGAVKYSTIEKSDPIVKPSTGTYTITDFHVSKGFYNDRVEIKWEVGNDAGFTGYIVTRTPWSTNGYEQQIYSEDNRGGKYQYMYEDRNAVPGVYYTYTLKGMVTCVTTQQAADIQGTGFVLPLGVVSGQVTFEGGNSVEDVQILVAGESHFENKAMEFNTAQGTYIKIPYKTNALTPQAVTLQTWVRRTRSGTNEEIFSSDCSYDLTIKGDGAISFTAYDSDHATHNYTTAANRVKTDDWHHVSVSFLADAGSNKARVMVYLDGKMTDSALITYPANKINFACNNDFSVIGGENGGFNGYLDEFRIWNVELNAEQIESTYDRYISGKEENLSHYYRFDEFSGSDVFDMSGRDNVFNENHGSVMGGLTSTRTTSFRPSEAQLSIKGVTDANGHYIISTIPYSADGILYTLTPVKGVHKFNPTSKPLFFSQNSNTHNNIDFTDISSFKVSGYVTYDGGTYPVEGVSLEIDDQTVLNGKTVCTTDADGYYEIHVPIGVHKLRAVKNGHTFINDGLALQNGEDINYHDEISNLNFKDITTVKVIGHIVGGRIEDDKVSGFGERINNIGSDVLSFKAAKSERYHIYSGAKTDTVLHNQGEWTKADSKRQDTSIVVANENGYTIHVSPTTGEYVAWLRPEKYEIQNIFVNGYGNIYEKLEMLDLTNSTVTTNDLLKTSIRTWTTSYKRPPQGNESDSVLVTTERSDTVKYNAEWGYFYQAMPTYTIQQEVAVGDTTVVVNYFGDKTFIVTSALTSRKDTLQIVSEDGEYLFGLPVFEQSQNYRFKLTGNEEYLNHRNGDTSKVPVINAVARISADLSSVAGEQTVNLDSTGVGYYNFMVGDPELLHGVRSLSTVLTIDGISYFSTLGVAGLNAYVLGMISTGNDFLTFGPNQMIAVLHDPPGSNSYSYIEKGSVWTCLTEGYKGFKGAQDLGFMISNGLKIMTGFGVETETQIILETDDAAQFREALQFGDKVEKSVVFTRRISTSASDKNVGHEADVYVGNATNILYGLSNSIIIMRKEDRTAITVTIDTFGDYAICKDEGIAMGQSFSTTFFYTQAEIEHIMIPKWKNVIDKILLPPNTVVDTNAITKPVYLSLYPVTDPRFGKSNTADSTYYLIIYPAGYVPPKKLKDGLTNRTAGTSADSVSIDIDSVSYYARQIEEWKQIMADNEKSQITLSERNPNQEGIVNWSGVSRDADTLTIDWAETFNENYNYSFGGGVTIEHSESNTTSKTDYYRREWYGGAFVSGKLGGKSAGIGGYAYLKTEEGEQHLTADNTITQTKMNIGFVLKESEYRDEITVDYGWTAKGTGALYTNVPPTIAFKTRGGRTSCPYEGAYLTKYYEPGHHILSEATMQVEKPSIRVKDGVYRVQVPASRAANFVLELGNLSESNSDVIYKLGDPEGSNQHGAVLIIDGLPLTSGSARSIFIEAGKTVEKTLSVLKGPIENNYENLEVRLSSACQSDPSDWLDDLFEEVEVSVEFVPSCSDVNIAAPVDKWVVNKTVTGDSMFIEIDNFDRNYANFGHIELQYRNSSEVQWHKLMDFYTDNARYDLGQGAKTLLSDADATAQYTWNMSQIADGNYEVRARSVCETTNGILINETVSDVVTGVKDMMLPQIFGTPHPVDGVLRSNEDLIITFNEQINEGKISHNNFSISGIKNDVATDHNTAVHFDGAGVYAISQSEFNFNFPMTIEFWCKRNALGESAIFSHGKGASAIYMGFNADNHLVLRISGNPEFVSENAITNTVEWGYYALVYNPDENRVYVYKAIGSDFDVEMDKQLLQPYQEKGFLVLGASRDLSEFGNFDMHGFCIWQRAHDAATLMANKDRVYGYNELGLYAYFPINEGYGTLIKEKEKSRHLVLSSPSWRNLPEGKSLYFDGVDDYFLMNTASSVAISKENNFTVDFWFKTNDSDGTLFSCGRGDGVQGEVAEQKLSISLLESNLLILTNGRSFRVSGIDVADNTWHHLTLSVDRSASANLFIDGELVLTVDALLFGGLEGETMTLGARHYRLISGDTWLDPVTDMYYNGYIDDLKIFNAPLNASYIEYFGNFHLNSNMSSLVAYYPFDRYVENSNGQMELVFDKNDQKMGSMADTSVLFGAEPSSEIAPVKGMWQVSDYAFDFITSTNKILINLTDNKNAIERTNIAISVKDIEDMHGNKMDGTSLWNAFIDRNTLFWDESSIKKTKKNGEELEFYVTIRNEDSKGVNFSIYNIPQWLTITPNEGSLTPLGSMELKFYVNEALNPGNYGAFLELRGDYSSYLDFELNVGEDRPEWKPNEHKYQNSMAVIGQLLIDNIISTNENDMVGAFINGECVGVGSPANSDGKWLVTLNIHNDNVSAAIDLLIWDDSKARIYMASPDNLTFTKNAITGSSTAPVQIRNVGNINVIPVHKGWNWISFNVKNSSDNSSMINIFNGIDNAVEIKNQGGTFIRYENDVWNGSLRNYGNAEMYMLKMDGDNALYQKGTAVDVTEESAHINRGWTWLGYMPQINTTIEEAFADAEPLPNDFVKSQNEIAIYDEHTGWEGTLKYLRPGIGYMYKSTVSRDFHYPENSSLEALDNIAVRKAGAGSEDKSIVSKFVNNLSMIATIEDIVIAGGEKLIAEVNGETRGSADPEAINGKMLFFMPVYADRERENVKFFIEQNGDKIPLLETINFNTDDIRGSVEQPFVFKIKKGNTPYVNVDDRKLAVFPNPVRDHFTVKTDLDADALLEIVNILGEIVYSQRVSSPFEITVSGAPVTNLKAGTYLVKISSAQSVLVSKIIKK
ncbi:MAG: T9SS type A sorting domain-containing protein [Bacteroidales bacterium]|jgi:hypothetical protein|nr:T9SS type A sorting domain-containing protein [Bacteroidales bacterium]